MRLDFGRIASSDIPKSAETRPEAAGRDFGEAGLRESPNRQILNCRVAASKGVRIMRKLNRRSFLTRVVGGAVAGGGALALTSGAGQAHPISDNDPNDPGGGGRSTQRFPHSDTDSGANSDPAGRAGRLGHFSDSDSGTGADPAGHGRRYSDSDPGDPANQRRSFSDSDSGAGSDPVGRGRRVRRR